MRVGSSPEEFFEMFFFVRYIFLGGLLIRIRRGFFFFAFVVAFLFHSSVFKFCFLSSKNFSFGENKEFGAIRN